MQRLRPLGYCDPAPEAPLITFVFFCSYSFSSAVGSVPRRWNRADPGGPGPRLPQVRETNRGRARDRKLDEIGKNDPMRTS